MYAIVTIYLTVWSPFSCMRALVARIFAVASSVSLPAFLSLLLFVWVSLRVQRTRIPIFTMLCHDWHPQEQFRALATSWH